LETKKAIIVSGYFNPLHVGHLELFTKAKACGDELWVIVNNDKQRALKGSKEFMNEYDRLAIVNAIRWVDKVFISIDRDKTQIRTLEYINSLFSSSYELFFANGGDQNNSTIAEAEICKKLNIKLLDRLGRKIQSSSWLLDKL